MDWNQLLNQEKASAEIIGAVILVGLTVTFAATITPALLGLTQQVTETPVAMFSFHEEDCNSSTGLEITHKSGDSIQASELHLRSEEVNISGSWANASGYTVEGAEDGMIDPGDKATVCSPELENATVSVVWEPEGHQGTTFSTWRGVAV